MNPLKAPSVECLVVLLLMHKITKVNKKVAQISAPKTYPNPNLGVSSYLLYSLSAGKYREYFGSKATLKILNFPHVKDPRATPKKAPKICPTI